MQINKITPAIPKKINKDSSGSNSQNIKQTNNKGQSFKRSYGPLDTFALTIADLVENGGLFVSFTLQDMLGTNIPRPIMGLMRNKKENHGQTNKKFAFKELTREMMTGPSMFIIPGAILFGVKLLFGKACEIPMKLIKSFGDIHASDPTFASGKPINNFAFFRNVFGEIIKNAKGEEAATRETMQTANNFAQRLTQSLKGNKAEKIGDAVKLAGNVNTLTRKSTNLVKKLAKNNTNDTIQDLADDFTRIAKQYTTDPVNADYTRAVLKNGVSAPFKDTVNFMISYSDDIVNKTIKTADKIRNSNESAARNFAARDFITKHVNNKIIGRFALNIIMYLAVMGFLQIIPKLYNKAEGKENTGLKGLMKEETLKDESLNKKQENKTNPSFKGAQGKNISFGSAASMATKLTSPGLISKLANGIEFEGINVSFPLLLGIMGFGILFPRIRQAKDKYDRTEILTRDVTTCATMCFGEKCLRKAFSKLNEKNSGFVLAMKEKGYKDKSRFGKIFSYLRPINGTRLLNSDQIVSQYSNITDMSKFFNFIEGQGGDIKKLLTFKEEPKELLKNILQRTGKTLEEANNDTIKEAFQNPRNSELVNEFLDMFKSKDNIWVKQAKTLNARFTALAICLFVPLFLGFMLPWINEKITKKTIKKENELKLHENNNQNPTIIQNKKAKELFNDMHMFR